MTQSELEEFFKFCQDNLERFNAHSCDESDHFYLDDVLIGGYAGDRQEFFYKHSDELARALRMMEASKAEE
jgi:hypothetical protein